MAKDTSSVNQTNYQYEFTEGLMISRLTTQIHLSDLRLNHAELDEEGSKILTQEGGGHGIFDTFLAKKS